VVAEARGPDDGVDAMFGTPRDVLARRVDHGEVDRDLRIRILQHARLGGDLEMRVVHAELIQVDARVERIHRGDELEVGRVEHSPTDGRTHPPARSEDPDANHPAAPFGVPTGYRWIPSCDTA